MISGCCSSCSGSSGELGKEKVSRGHLSRSGKLTRTNRPWDEENEVVFNCHRYMSGYRYMGIVVDRFYCSSEHDNMDSRRCGRMGQICLN